MFPTSLKSQYLVFFYQRQISGELKRNFSAHTSICTVKVKYPADITRRTHSSGCRLECWFQDSFDFQYCFSVRFWDFVWSKKRATLMLSIFFSSFISYDSAPLSASLLSDWSEVHRMTPADLESLQQELQLGSPMILSDTIPPDA